MEIKTKVNKWDPIKLTKLLHNKENYKQGEKTTSEWEQIIAIKTTDKGLISKKCKHLIKLNARKKKNLPKRGKKT